MVVLIRLRIDEFILFVIVDVVCRLICVILSVLRLFWENVLLIKLVVSLVSSVVILLFGLLVFRVDKRVSIELYLLVFLVFLVFNGVILIVVGVILEVLKWILKCRW